MAEKTALLQVELSAQVPLSGSVRTNFGANPEPALASLSPAFDGEVVDMWDMPVVC